MKTYFAYAILLFAACPFVRGQAAPAATSGTAGLRYALRYAETAEFTDTLGTWHTINTSGSLDYANGRARQPFSLDYTGGYSSTVSGPSYATGAFHRLMLSQGFDWRKWFLNLSDDIGYRPQSPTTGFSGIPGTGEPIGGGPNPPPSQSIFIVSTHVLDNNSSAQLQHIFSHDLIFNVNAGHNLLRYPKGNGLDTDGLTIGASPTFRLDARNSLFIQYAFTRFTYSESDVQFETDKVSFGYQKTWNRAFRTSASVGPEWIRASAFFPGSTEISAKASLDYQSRDWSAGLAYGRGTSGGSGYLMGAQSDSISANLSRPLARTVTLEMGGGYRHTSQLIHKGNIAAEFGSLQASWRVGRYLNAFANYTAMSQSTSAQVPSNVLNQLMQTVSIGIGFSKDIKAAK